MDRNQTPLFDALLTHKKQNPLSFHVPGHKNGTFFHEKGISVYSESLKLDVTELSGLDDLHEPEGVIRDAQALAAQYFNVQSTYFLVNGSTVGNIAMILACCREGDIVLVQRNCHKSIIHGIMLSGATPVFLSPKVDNELFVPSYVSYETVSHAIQKYPQAKALILTNPNYYGLAYTRLREVVEIAHSHRIPVLVDEAHGAHFQLSSIFPTSAIEAGADIVVHSAHKTLPALTMGSYLHFNSGFIKEEDVKKYLAMLQSSSPSYLIMASLDLARAYMETFDTKKMEQGIEGLTATIQQLNGVDVIYSNDPFVKQDSLKITLRSTYGLSGFMLQKQLEKGGVFVELADPQNVLFILPLMFDEGYRFRLRQLNLYNVSGDRTVSIKKETKWMVEQDSISIGISFKELEKMNKRLIPIDQAVGEICGELIIPYPPGVPLLMEGERITQAHIEQIILLKSMNAKIQGGKGLKDDSIMIYV